MFQIQIGEIFGNICCKKHSNVGKFLGGTTTPGRNVFDVWIFRG